MSQQFGFSSTATEVATAFSDRIKGRTVLVTGVSPRGLGSETARAVANAGASLVILASRTRSKVDEVIAAIKKENPSANLRFVELDLNSIDSARKAGKEVLAYKEPLHVVINNAALTGPYRRTKDGLESQFGANHIGHFVFTNTIIPKLIETAKADPSYKPRIVNVSSGAHKWSPILFEDVGFSEGKTYDGLKAYGQSKTANILYSVGLVDRLAQHGILAYSLHPGVIHTELAREMTREELIEVGMMDKDGNLKEVIGPRNIQTKSLGQGASTHIFAAFSPDIEGYPGAYLLDAKLSSPDDLADHASSKENADKLWELSEKLVGEKYAF